MRDDVAVQIPPLTLMVLDGLADDLESVGTLRDHGEVTPYGLALVDEQDVVDALRELLVGGFVEALELTEPKLGLVPAAAPQTDDANLRRYWFRSTEAGKRAWRDGYPVLDAYWDAHPPGD